MGNGNVPSSLDKVHDAVAAVVHWPDNVGVELSRLRLPTRPQTEFLAVYVRGLADEELIRTRVIDPLHRVARENPTNRTFSPEVLRAVLASPRLQAVTELTAAVEGVLEGATALFFDGSARAVLVETSGAVSLPAGSAVGETPLKEMFDADLVKNVALLRKRLRSPNLLARPVAVRQRADSAALVYLEGRASPDLVQRVREFIERGAGEEAMRRGLASGWKGKFGLLPRLMTSRWPDKAAALVDAGYVVALVDRLPVAYMAPVTAPALLYGPLDDVLVRPISVLLRLFRAVMAILVTMAPAIVIALMNYHQEMMPTPFLLSLAAVREQSPFPIILEMLLLESLQELIREIGFHLPLRMAPGSALVAGKILVLILAQSGAVGALPAAVSVGVAMTTLGLIGYDLIYMARIWRLLFMMGAAVFGFFGMSAALFLLIAYLSRAESFGVPFLGETGLSFSSPGRVSSRRTGGSLSG